MGGCSGCRYITTGKLRVRVVGIYIICNNGGGGGSICIIIWLKLLCISAPSSSRLLPFMIALYRATPRAPLFSLNQALGTRASESSFAYPEDSSTQIKSTDLGRCQRSTLYLVKFNSTLPEDHCNSSSNF